MRESKTTHWDFLDFDWEPESAAKMDRRKFLKVAGSGLFLFFFVSDVSSLVQTGERRFGSRYPSDFNAYLRIAEDGSVTCFTGKIEMGQGVVTSLAMELAEELDVPLERVKMVMGDTDLCPWDMGTFGSLSTRYFGPALRKAAAEARQVLLQLAAQHLNVPVARLRTEAGNIFDQQNPGKKVTYQDLTRGKRIERRLGEVVMPKDPSEFKLMGRPVNRRDAQEKVTGKALYAADIRFPNMLYAKILRPPAHGATLLNVDLSEVQSLPDTEVYREGEFIAVLHPRPDVAEQALQKVRAQFQVPEPTVDDKTIFKHLLNVAPQGEVVDTGGNLKMGESQSSQITESVYYNSYVAHAPMEPHAATAKPEGDRLVVWASTQNPFTLKQQIAGELGLEEEQVRVITPYVGGGFGGKTNNRQALEAARLAHALGRPVQVNWNRSEEFFYDTFRPAAIVKIRSGLSDSGRISLWDYHVYFAGQRGAVHFYHIPHHQTVVYGSSWRAAPGSHPFATGAWRAPANNTNTFARESQIDMMARQAGMDPVEFRLLHLKDQRMRRVLRTAAEKFDWKSRQAPAGHGIGVSCGIDAGTYVATCAEVEVNRKDGNVKVKRVVAAQDMGVVVNPEGARIQMEGCIMMGLGYALTEEVRFNGGQILERNFDTYEIPRFSWLPAIETVLIDNNELAPQGGGEPAIINMGAVLANAIFDATGIRLYQLPMTPQRILDALRQAKT